MNPLYEKYKAHLTKAQAQQLARLTERYKQIMAQKRADSYNQLHSQSSSALRGLQNMGLAGRKGNLVSGGQKAADISAQEAQRDYNQAVTAASMGYAEQAAARMANATRRAEYVAEVAEQQKKATADAEKYRKEYEAALARQRAAEAQYRKMLEERAKQEAERERTAPAIREMAAMKQAAQNGRPAMWNKRETDSGSALGTAYDPYAHGTAENIRYYQAEAQKNGLKGADANRYAVQKAADIANRQGAAANAITTEQQRRASENINAVMQRPEYRFVADYGVDMQKVRREDPEGAADMTKRITAAYNDIDKKTSAWEKAIEYGERAMSAKENFQGKSEAVKNMQTARKEMAASYAILGRMQVAATQPVEYRDLYMMTDEEFDVAYDAAKKLYEDASQGRVIAGYHAAPSEADIKTQTERFTKYEQARLAREMTTELAYKHNLVPVESKEKHVKDGMQDRKVDYYPINNKYEGKSYVLGNGRRREPENGKILPYDEEHGTENSLYAAIINEYAPTLDYNEKASRYTAGGKLDGNSPGFSRMVQILEEKKAGIVNPEKSLAGKQQKMIAVLVSASYMTEEEVARFNTILDKYGAKEADEYFEYLYDTVLPIRVNQAIDEDYDAMLRRETVYDENGNRIGAKDGKDTWLAQLTSSVLSVPLNIVEGITNPLNTIMTRQQDSVAARFSARRNSGAQEMRNAVQENFSETGKFFYGTGMSMADSAVVAAISGGIGKSLSGIGVPAKSATKIGSVLGGSLLGGSAYNSAYSEALQRGLTPDKARLTAVGQGINEMLFESLSLDMLVGHYAKGGLLKVSKKAGVNWIVNTLVQGGVEGSEEFFTDIANRIWDNQVNGIFSEELTQIRKYISEGMSYEDAKAQVNREFAAQLALSFAGGAISGGVMGGGASFLGMLQGQDVAKIGRNLDDAAKAEIRAHDFQNAEAQELLGGKLTDEDYGRLAMTRLEEMAQTDPFAAEKAAQALIDATARTDVKVDKRNQTLKTGTENSVSFDYDGVTDVKKMSGVQVEALRFAQTLVKSKVGGVNINVANQLFDKNGNEQNGWYDAKTNTVHVSLNGSQSVVYTISHELTHRLKSGNKEAFASMRDAMKSELESLDLTGSDLPSEYENILGDYLVKDGEQRTAWEALIEYEMDRYAKHGITLDRESAEEEVVCRACETMLERSRLISTMISRNVRGAKTIAKFLSSIYDDIASLKEEAESRGYADGSPEKLFIDQYADVEKIANAWANAMKTVSQDTTKKIVKEEGRGGTAFSLKQELRDDGQSLADKSMKYRKAHKAESQHISDEMLEAANKQIHRMAQRMLPFLTLKNKKGMTYLPDEVLGKTRFGNSSYGGTSIENTTICFRTLAYIDFTNEIKKQIGRPLTVSESFLASQMLYQIAKEPQCLYCYVSLDRKAYDEQLLSYIKQRDNVVEGFNKLSLDERQAITKATRNPSKAFEGDVPLYTEFLAGRKNTEQMRTRFAQWIDIANSGSEAITAADLATDERRGLMRNGDDWQDTKRTAGKVSLQDQVIDAERYAQSASWAKKMEEYRAYNGDILKIGKRTVNKLNNEYGLRFYSFSEYSPAFIVENMQQIRDAALKGLMGLAYTKKTDFARIFAGTGMNINVSTFGRWGVDADGNRVVVMDSDQGADWTEVQNLRKQYENVGAVFVATDDAMTEWAIKQDWIDVVIPFHIVRTGANVAEFYKWVVHNSEQNDVTAEGKNATIPAAEHGNSYEKYMSLVNERGLTPRFDKWRPENNPNVTADEYMKLVNETRRTLDETNPLQPIYDTREAARSFGAFVHDGGYYGDYYKANSEQDIKVPIYPAQDILGIGSKTYTEQEGIDRVVADIKAGNKANQVPYGRQDIDEQISRLNKARQVKQHGQKFSLKEIDAQYMDLARRYESGDKSVEAELRKAVDAAAKAAGYTIKAWHGTYRFGGTKFTSQYGPLFLSSNPDVGQAFSGDQPVRAIAKQANPDTMDIDEAARWYKQNVHWGEFRVATDADFKHEIERLQPLSESVRQKYHLSEEEEAWKDKALKKVESKYSRFLNGEKFYYFEYNGINHDYGNSPFADVNDFRNVVRERLVKNDNGGGVYEMYISPKNMITVDANGAYYASIPLPSELRKYATAEEKRIGKVTSDQLVRIADEAGYDTLEIKNVVEGGDYGRTAKATDYVVMNPESQAKSADLITKDDSGNIIPLSERFKTDRTGEDAWKNEDIRYSIRGRNALYSEIGTLDSTKLRDKQGKENLNIAYKMDREGIDSEKIRLATGWFKGYDGKWRNEIDDSGAKLADWLVLGKGIRYMEEKARKTAFDLYDKIDSLENRLKKSNKVNGADSEQSKALRKELRKTRKQREEAVDFSNSIAINRIKLSDILDHAKLYENYPQLKDVTVHLDYSDRTGYLGSASGTTDITITTDRNSKEEILQSLMHEVQHIIQGIEGFAKGANVEYWADRNMRESADLKDAKATLAQVERDLSSVKYEGNPQASPLKTAVSYAYITDQLRKDKPGTANYAYDTEQKEKYEKRAEEAGYADLLKKYLIAYQDVNVAKMEAKDYTKAFADYQRTAGEVEARDVASRLRMSEDERKATRPDIDRSDVTFFETDRTGEDAWKNEDIRYSLKDDVKQSDITEYEHFDEEKYAKMSETERIEYREHIAEMQIRKEARERQRAIDRNRRIRRDLTATLKKGNDRIVKMLANPTENSHVPVQLAQAVAEYAQRLNELLVADVNYVRDNPPSVEDVKAYIDEHGYNVDANRFVDFYTGRGWLANSGLPMTNWKLNVASWAKRGVPQNVSGRQMTGAEKIIDALNRSYADKETIDALKAEDPSFNPRGLLVQYDEKGNIVKDETLVKMINGMDSIIQGKHLSELTEDELRLVLNTMRGVIHTVTEANKVTVKGEMRNVYRESRQMANEVNSATKVFGDKKNKLTQFMNRYVIESLGLRRIAKLYSGSNEDAVFVKMVDDLNDGALEQERIKQTLRAMFNDVTSKYEKDMKTWYGKNAEWIDTGFGFKITKGMRVSLAMHILNEQNLRNVEKAGLRIPNMSIYKKGNYKEAYNNGKVVRLTKAQAEQIVSHMTEAEKAYFEVAKEFFHKRSGYYINRTSLKLLGYSKAVVKNYFPIQTDDAYRTVKYDDVRQNASVEHPGFLETRKGTANVMYLNDITAVVNRQIDGVAKYAGLAIPMRNWNNVMNAWLFEENENGEWVRSDDGRAHNVLENRMSGEGKSVMKYVDKFVTDLASSGINDTNDVDAAKFAAKLTSNYVKAVLTLNLRVALSQTASVPTAAAEIPWKYLVQSFGGHVEGHLNSNESNDLIDQYTQIFAMRRAGTQTEVSEVMKRKGFSDKAEQKLPGLLGWITAMDVAATRRLWYACERWVKGETNIPVGSDAFYKEVAKRYERVIQNTQPNFTVLQRSPALRSKNAAARIITMFGTQRMQNAGVFIESLAEVVQAKDKATRKAALKKFGRTLSGLITAAIVIGLERAIVSAIRGRMKPLQDDDKEITAKSIDKYIRGEIGTSLAGSFMYVGELYDFVSGIVGGITDGDSGYDQSFALPAAEALSTMIKFFRNQDWQYFEYMTAKDEHGNPKHTDHEKWLKTKSFVNELMTVASYATGLPLQNASKTILNGWLPLGQDIADAIKTGEFIPYLNQSGKLDSAKTAANYKEWTNLGKKGSVYLYWEEVAKQIKDDNDLPNKKTLAMRLSDSDLTPEESATIYRMLMGTDYVQDGAKVYNKVTTNQKLDASRKGQEDPEYGNIVVDFSDEYALQMSLRGDSKYDAYTNAVKDGVPKRTAYEAFVLWENAKRYETRIGRDAEEYFLSRLNAAISDPHQVAVLAKYIIGKKEYKLEASAASNDTADAKAAEFAALYKGYTAKDGIVYNENGVVQADFTSDEAYRASQLGESNYKKYTDAVGKGLSRENAIKVVEAHKELTSDDDKSNASQYASWIFKNLKNPKDRAIAGAIYTTNPVTVKDGRTYDENGYIYRDYTSAAWYKLSNRKLSNDGVNKRYEAAKLLEKDGYTAEKTVAAYVELDKLSKKSEWQNWLKDHGYTNDQIKIILWSRGWAKLK